MALLVWLAAAGKSMLVPAADVKRKVSPEILKEIGPLMKLYQEEVDKLSNRWPHASCGTYWLHPGIS
jgi:hypothetical protein